MLGILRSSAQRFARERLNIDHRPENVGRSRQEHQPEALVLDPDDPPSSRCWFVGWNRGRRAPRIAVAELLDRAPKGSTAYNKFYAARQLRFGVDVSMRTGTDGRARMQMIAGVGHETLFRLDSL